MICFCDLETTGTNVFSAEIIEGYFICTDTELNVIGTFHLRCRPTEWSHEAYLVHQIPKHIADNYPLFKDCYNDLLDWFNVNKIDEFWCHTNAHMFGKVTHFDYAILKMQLFDVNQGEYFKMHNKKVYSTHSLCKLLKDRFNFSSLSLDSICSVLGIKLKHHDCKSDAEACLEITKRLLPLTDRETVKTLGVKYDTIEDDQGQSVTQRRDPSIHQRKPKPPSKDRAWNSPIFR